MSNQTPANVTIRYAPQSATIGDAAPKPPWSLVIGPPLPDGSPLLQIHADGNVTGAVENASEAGRIFVEYIRANFGSLQ